MGKELEIDRGGDQLDGTRALLNRTPLVQRLLVPTHSLSLSLSFSRTLSIFSVIPSPQPSITSNKQIRLQRGIYIVAQQISDGLLAQPSELSISDQWANRVG